MIKVKNTMKQTFAAVVVAGTMLGMSQVHASGHFKGKPAETLEQAVQNLKEYNPKLEAIVNQDKISTAQMGEIHQLTYTLENALERLEKEIDIIEDLLEDVHKASEKADYEKAKKQGRAYIEKMNTLLK